MQKLTAKQISNAVSGIRKASDKAHLTVVLFNIAYQTAHGNISNAVQLLDPSVPGALRGWIGKNTGVKRVKNKETKNIEFQFDKEKQDNLLSSWGLGFEPDFEELCEKLPAVFEEKDKTTKPVDAIASAKRLLAKLEKAAEDGNLVEGTEESAAMVIKALAKFNI